MCRAMALALAVSLWACAQAPGAQSVVQDAPLQEIPTHDAPAAREPDLPGIRRDTAYFLGYQFVAVGLISLAPQSDSNYHEDIGFERWWHNVTHPRWDSDTAFVNYVLHPYWGAAYYVRARERGLSRKQSFWYSALLSTIYEFGAEAMVEQVSYQDLVATPVLGSLLGEYVFSPWRERILAAPGPLTGSDRLVLVLTDPLGAINSAVGRLFGLEEQQVSVTPLLRHGSLPGALPAHPGTQPGAPPLKWGLQLRVRW